MNCLAFEDESKLGPRRVLMFGLCVATMAGLATVMGHILGVRGWSPLTVSFMALYLVGLPWTLLGFWNSVIGFLILRLAKDPAALVNPALRAQVSETPITDRTAICLAVRNEDAGAAFERLRVMIESLGATGQGGHFDFHVLSDTNRADVAKAEERLFADLRLRYPRVGLHYRRRALNTGFKAGSLEEFAKRCRHLYQHMIVLDADSVMSGRAMLRLVRLMQANPRLGILQTLVVGRPSESAFTRIFQFGMRHGMRAQTIGSAWWQGSAGPYWGHNAIIRIAPFVDCCQLPSLPGDGPLSGAVLSHDQLEAALMRGAGWEVRVIPEEFESWEENPTNLQDFVKRDLRWCQGNLQYLKLLRMKGLHGMGRFQLINAIMMYAGAPMNFLMLITGLSIILIPNPPEMATTMAFRLFALSMALGFAPRLLGVADILLSGRAASYGGVARLLAGCVVDAAVSLLMGPVMMLCQTRFIVGLMFGRSIVWDAQNRADRSVTVLEAVHGLWLHLAIGLTIVAVLSAFLPIALPWAAMTFVPLILAIPLTCITASPALGRWMTRGGLCAIPDELVPAWELAPVDRRVGAAAATGQVALKVA